MEKGGTWQQAISRTQRGEGISLTFVIFQDPWASVKFNMIRIEVKIRDLGGEMFWQLYVKDW